MSKRNGMTDSMQDYEKGSPLGAWLVFIMVLIGFVAMIVINQAYASGGIETPENTAPIVINTDDQTNKVCKMDCQERVYCDHQTWCNTLTEQGTCEYIEVKE